MGMVYFLDTNFGVKIGFTDSDLHKRLLAFHKNFVFTFRHAIQHAHPYALEQHFHHEFRLARNPNTIASHEIFRLTPKQIEYVLSLENFQGAPCVHFMTLASADPDSNDYFDAIWGYRASKRKIVLPSGKVCILPEPEAPSQLSLFEAQP